MLRSNCRLPCPGCSVHRAEGRVISWLLADSSRYYRSPAGRSPPSLPDGLDSRASLKPRVFGFAGDCYGSFGHLVRFLRGYFVSRRDRWQRLSSHLSSKRDLRQTRLKHKYANRTLHLSVKYNLNYASRDTCDRNIDSLKAPYRQALLVQDRKRTLKGWPEFSDIFHNSRLSAAAVAHVDCHRA